MFIPIYIIKKNKKINFFTKFNYLIKKSSFFVNFLPSLVFLDFLYFMVL